MTAGEGRQRCDERKEVRKMVMMMVVEEGDRSKELQERDSV